MLVTNIKGGAHVIIFVAGLSGGWVRNPEVRAYTDFLVHMWHSFPAQSKDAQAFNAVTVHSISQVLLFIRTAKRTARGRC